MSPEAQQFVMAAVCGYTNIRRCTCNPDGGNGRLSGTAADGRDVTHIPDYLKDLNTRGELLSVLVDKELGGKFAHRFIDKWDALTVPQSRFCTEFLRTIGEWKDE